MIRLFFWHLSLSTILRILCVGAVLSTIPLSPLDARQLPVRAVISGSTVYDADHLLAYAYHHIRSSEGAVTPSRLAAAVELIYREDGYLLAEVQLVPSADGRSVELRIHEGHIEHVSIEGVDERMHARIRETVAPLLSARPLARKKFERAMALVSDLAGLDVTSEIDHPKGRSGARLRIIARQERASGSVTIDNPPRQFGKALSLHADKSFYSVLSPGDVLRLFAGGSIHFNEVGDGREFYGIATYRSPISGEGTYVEAVAGNVQAVRDASGKFVSTDLEGKIFGAAIGHPFWRDFHNYGYGLLEFRHSGVQSDGGGFSFESASNVGAGGVLYGHVFNGGGILELGLTVSAGERDGTPPAGTDDGDDTFWHFRVGGGFVAPIAVAAHHIALQGQILAQLSRDRLPAVEELHLGDRQLLRGYELAEVNGDTGFAAKLEISRHVDNYGDLLHSLKPFAFVDLGHVRNHAPGPFEVSSKTLASAGVGLDAVLTHGFSMRSWLGVPLMHGPHTRQHSPAGYLAITKSW